MKYIKNFYEKIYWLLPTDKRFENSLKEIGCDPIRKKDFLENRTLLEYQFVFIGFEDKKNWDDWGWNPYENLSEIDNNWFKNHKYKFMGFVNTTIEELELVEFTNKFNL